MRSSEEEGRSCGRKFCLNVELYSVTCAKRGASNTMYISYVCEPLESYTVGPQPSRTTFGKMLLLLGYDPVCVRLVHRVGNCLFVN